MKKKSKFGLAYSGSALLEQVLAIGLFGGLLLIVAALTVKNSEAAHKAQYRFEATCLAEDLLETQLTRSLASLQLGIAPANTGHFKDGTDYRSVVEVYSVVGAGSGLTDKELLGVRASISWSDRQGAQRVVSESLLAKIAR